METVGLREARERLGELVDQAQHKRIPTEITRYGRPFAVLVNADWYEAHKGDEDTSVNTARSLPENLRDR